MTIGRCDDVLLSQCKLGTGRNRQCVTFVVDDVGKDGTGVLSGSFKSASGG